MTVKLARKLKMLIQKFESQNPPPDCEPKRASNRRKVDTAQVAADENDSPASTLQVQSSDDDLE